MVPERRPLRSHLLAFGGAAFWALLVVRWFDAGASFRPAGLVAVPPAVLGALAFGCSVACLWARRADLRGEPAPATQSGLLLVVALTALFRLPLAWQGAAGYTTADGALSGIVALHVRDAVAHDVFLPQLPYSGSLKAHLTAPLASVMDPARAFALVSVLFYSLFVAAVYRLALLVDGAPSLALLAGLYVAFSPTFVTHYSLSNDGNYVEVLAFGTWALVLAARWGQERARRGLLAVVIGLLVGVGAWCHILVVFHATAIAIFLLLVDLRGALAAIPRGLAGFALGYLPGLVWNAGHSWDSFRSVVPGSQPAAAGAHGPGLAARAVATATDHMPILMGYDTGYPPAVDAVLRAAAIAATLLVVLVLGRAIRDARGRRPDALWLVLVFTAANFVVAIVALRYVPHNPRYLLFLMASLPIFLARGLGVGWKRWVLGALLAVGALGSLAQASSEVESDHRWRTFVSNLEAEGVRHCYTDFYLATKINFLSEERVTCSAKLGPTRTEYFFEYRERVDQAAEAAFVAGNAASADKLARRLDRLGVSYQRRDLMKPLLLKLSRKVDPQELFPDQSFGLR
jgi:hypothetical protein